MVCKVKADSQVNLALESQLVREAQWVGKSSTVVKCHEIYQKVSDNMTTSENCHHLETALNNERSSYAGGPVSILGKV